MAGTARAGNLAPLADVVAFGSPDPRRRWEVGGELAARFGMGSALEAAGWVVAVAAVAGSRLVPSAAGEAGFAFTEGAERVAAASAATGGFDGLAAAMRTRRWGALDGTPGDVGFVWVDERGTGAAGDLVAVRSAAGRVPLWWWARDGEACVGSRLSVVAGLRGDVAFDPLAAPAFVAGQAAFPDGRSVVDGVRIVAPGSVLHVPPPGESRASPSVQRWFDPWPDLRDGRPPARRGRHRFGEAAERFGDAVRGVLGDELDAAGGNLLSLSGGVDSSSLAFLAAEAGRPVAALSLVPDADDPLHGREMSFVEPIVSQLGIEPHWARALTTEHRLEWLGQAPRAPMPVVHPVLCLLPEVRGGFDAGVLVGGEFCDELSGGAFMLVDWARTASPVDAAWAVRHGVVGRTWGKRWLRYGLKGVPPVGPHRELPEVFQREARDEWASWRAERHEVVASSSRVHAYTIELLSSLDGAVAMNWEVCASLGIRRVWPFLSREVIEVVASLRPHDLVVPVQKRLSRVAFRGAVPDRWLDRADDGSFGKGRTFGGVSFGSLPDDLAPFLRPEVAAGAEPVTEEVAALAVAAGLQLTRSLQALRTT